MSTTVLNGSNAMCCQIPDTTHHGLSNKLFIRRICIVQAQAQSSEPLTRPSGADAVRESRKGTRYLA
jgi:hypothetical protein